MSSVENVACRGAARRVDEGELRQHLRREQDGQEPEVREDRAEGDVQPALQEEEGSQEGEGDHAQSCLLLAMLLVVAAHDEPEHERGQDGVPVRGLREHYQYEEAREDELDLGLDHAVAVAAEEPGRGPRQAEDERERDDEEDGEPEVRRKEDGRERERGAEVGDEGRAHEQLPDTGIAQSALDEDGVHDRERGRREGRSRDERSLPRPVEREVADEGRH
jgi:hypothetical protein